MLNSIRNLLKDIGSFAGSHPQFVTWFVTGVATALAYFGFKATVSEVSVVVSAVLTVISVLTGSSAAKVKQSAGK